MFSSYTLKTEQSVIKLLQLTDQHLFQSEQAQLLGINTQASFAQVLKEILQQNQHFDAVLATGDLVQDESTQGYLRLMEMLKTLDTPTFWLPGNHDFQPKMVEILNSPPIYPMKHLLLGKYWQAILLDSQVFGVPHGELSAYQLAFLAQKLTEYPERFALVVLHHHIVPTRSAWLDQHNLRNPYDLFALLRKFPKVKGILYGHIHQQVDCQWQGFHIMATPSTCVQFKPDNNQFALDELQPGWREISLLPNGELETCVKRIQQVQFLPNLQEEGY